VQLSKIVKAKMNPQQLTICPDPIFVIGSARSGTTALAFALNKHSQLFNLNETTILIDLFGGDKAVQAYRTSVERPAPTMLRTLGVKLDEFLECLGVGINTLFTRKSEGKRWIDKTPQYTLLVDLLADLFPGAYFIHMLRDGRRVVNSMANFHNAPSRELERKKVGAIKPWDFKNACQVWSRYVEICLDFQSRHPTRCLTVINENLVADPAKGFRRLFEFIHAPYEEAPAEYFGSHQINSSFWEGGRVDSPLIERFSDPWETWTAEQQQTFKEKAAQTLTRCGFVLPDEPLSTTHSSGIEDPKPMVAEKVRGPAKSDKSDKSDNRTFIVLSAGLSGSDLLRDYLNQHASIRCLGEIFKKSFVNEKGWQRLSGGSAELKHLHETDLVSFWKHILERYKLDKPVIGAKIFYFHREDDEIWRYFASSHTPIIHLVRGELIDSYLSLKLAEVSGIWKQPRNKKTDAEHDRNISVDLADFENYCRRMERYIDRTRMLFGDNPSLQVDYSSLVSDRQNSMSAVYSFLGLPDHETAPRLSKQLSRNREELITNWDETASFISSNQELCVIS
jgi:hypothetical protein